MDYPRYHRHRGNLLLHLVLVPLFASAGLVALVGLASGRWFLAAGGLATALLSLALQGVGHRREPVPPEPFAGPADFVGRVLAEQYWRWWRFVLGGGWWRAWREAGAASARGRDAGDAPPPPGEHPASR